MPLHEALIAELKHESTLTRKMLERVPLDQGDWKPHEKSMTLARLATHIADITHWITDIHRIDDFDFLKDYNFKPVIAASPEILLGIFQKNLDRALETMAGMGDEEMSKLWTVRRGEQVMFSIPKKVALRGWAFNHMVHHRGQLSVYLRLLGVPVPGMYGPSADEQV